MPSFKFTAPDGRKFKVTVPEGATEADALLYAEQNMPPPDPPKPPKGDSYGVLTGGLADTLGMTDRPGAHRITEPGKPGYRTPVDVILRPEGALEHGASIATQAGLGGAAGAGVKAAVGLPAVAGRLAASGAFGAARGATTPGESALGETAKNLAASGIAEGTLGALGSGSSLVGKLPGTLANLGAAARGATWSAEGPLKAIEFLGPKFAKAQILVPTFGPSKIPADQAAARLAGLTGGAYKVAREEMAAALDVVDKAAKNPRGAGNIFRHFTADFRAEPSTSARVAEGVRSATRNPAVRAGADALADQSPEATIGGALTMGPSFGGVAREVIPAMTRH